MKCLQKLLTAAATTAMFVAAMPMAQAAGSTSAPFNVTVTLNAACSITTAPGTVNFGAYAAITNGAASASTGFGVTCTNGLPYSMGFDAPASQSVAGLTYTLAVKDSSNTTTITGSQTGLGSEVAYNISGSMAGGQAGDAAAATTQGRTLMITY